MENTKAGLNPTAKRHPTKELATLEVHGRTVKVQCRMNNLSVTGAFFELINSNYVPKQGDLVRMTVSLRQVNRTHTLHGQVIWSRGLGLGVSFIKDREVYDILSKTSRSAI